MFDHLRSAVQNSWAAIPRGQVEALLESHDNLLEACKAFCEAYNSSSDYISEYSQDMLFEQFKSAIAKAEGRS